ncbi:unnamed protein product [Adineta ricciae]|uniref:G-protein coupled receptors family 1 profile domain-containing protein n=1 Tax=Adineta ricciae TaxID=249248 RepID=A0A813R0Z8_ADIRI|nr:unnamed protein product [Adineta ricciae]
MTVLSPSSVIGQIRQLTSTIANLLALFLSLILLCLFIYKFFRFNTFQRKKFSSETSIFLAINTLILLVTRSILQFFEVDLNTIKRDYFPPQEFHDSFSCRFRAYILLSVHSTLYWSYVLKSIFRFTRVIYPAYVRLHQVTTYVYIFIPIHYLIGFLTTLPIWAGFNAIYLLPNEPYCTASYNELASLIYMPIVAFVLPLSIISICYMCIVVQIRRTAAVSSVNQSRNRRDFVVIRRIIMIIAILSMVSLPLFIDLFVFLPKGYIDPNMNSIGWLSSSINAVILTLSLPFIDPKMYRLISKTDVVHTCT